VSDVQINALAVRMIASFGPGAAGIGFSTSATDPIFCITKAFIFLLMESLQFDSVFLTGAREDRRTDVALRPHQKPSRPLSCETHTLSVARQMVTTILGGVWQHQAQLGDGIA
jgi:hypothetical protein